MTSSTLRWEKLHKINLNLWFSNWYELMVKQNNWHSCISVANRRFLMFNVFKVCPVIWQISKVRFWLRLYKANCQCPAIICFHICTLSPGVKNILPITTAKVPIVKFYHVRTGLEGDISLYNTLVGLFLLLFFPCFVLSQICYNIIILLCFKMTSFFSGSAQHSPLSFVCCHWQESEDTLLCHEGFCQSEYALHTRS